MEGVFHGASDAFIDGTMTVGGAVMGRGPYMDSSDARLKRDVREISSSDALAIVRELR